MSSQGCGRALLVEAVEEVDVAVVEAFGGALPVPTIVWRDLPEEVRRLAVAAAALAGGEIH